MADKESSPTNAKEQALQIVEAWKNLGDTVTLGDMTLAEYEADIKGYDSVETRIKNLQDQLTEARNELKSKRYRIWNSTKRVRASVQGKYGDDSSEYERFGGKRMSERKRRASRSAPPAQP